MISFIRAYVNPSGWIKDFKNQEEKKINSLILELDQFHQNIELLKLLRFIKDNFLNIQLVSMVQQFGLSKLPEFSKFSDKVFKRKSVCEFIQKIVVQGLCTEMKEVTMEVQRNTRSHHSHHQNRRARKQRKISC